MSIGEYWLSAGIQFTSYELIQTFALLTVEFGTELEIGLLGLSTISVPNGDPVPIGFAQLALDIRILPDEGIYAVEAGLTQASYILAEACHLTGGFAFYLWTSPNEH